MNQFMQILVTVSLYIPIYLGYKAGMDFLGNDFPLFFGLSLQAVIGTVILIYVRGYEKEDLSSIYFGYLLLYMGLSGAYLSGKTFWFPAFWELSTLGILFLYKGETYTVKSIKSMIALFLASSTSMAFLAAWVFLPDGVPGTILLLIGLLIKSGFSGLHMWYPEMHSGAPAHASATYSGLMLNITFLIFIRYILPVWNDIPYGNYLVPVSGIGVFLGGVASFFNKDIKRSLAYSTVENSNFMWLYLFVASHWWTSENSELLSISRSFYVLFFILLVHHSFSKVYQFLIAGYICKNTGSTALDKNKGAGRLTGLSVIQLGIGSFSFAVIPGTTGFIAESTLLYLVSRTIDLSKVDDSVFFLMAIMLSLSGIVLGSASHLRIFLPTALSVPNKTVSDSWTEEKRKAPASIFVSLNMIALFIIILPLVFIIPFHYFQGMANWIPDYLLGWFDKISIISMSMVLIFASVGLFRWSHRIQKRRLWDCGSAYVGQELSIPASVISDPLYPSTGRHFINQDGELKLDSFISRSIVYSLDIGKFWIHKVESGAVAQYLLFSVLSFLVSLVFIIVLRVHF